MNRKIILYFGASCDGKGLVDSISAFAVKNPLRKGVYTEDFILDSVDDILKLLKDKFGENEKKKLL